MTPDDVWIGLQLLVGSWEGEGVGWFPTIDDFAYRETVEIEGGSEGRQLRFSQTSWRQVDEGERESHTEVGFIAVADGGGVEMTVAEAVDRVEVLTGTVRADGDGYLLEVTTVAVAHDERVISSWRRWAFGPDQIDYTMGMATTAVPDGRPHLEGRLTRVR